MKNDNDVAFNQGADARIAGKIPETNPYMVLSSSWYCWVRGWDHCHKKWGVDAKWPVKVLPEVGRRRAG